MNIKLIPRNPFPHKILDILIAIYECFSKKNDFLKLLLNFIGVKSGILVSSGREAFYFILKVCLKKNDEIILPAFTCNVLLGAIKRSGVKPVFADISLDSLNMELEHIEKLISQKTKAILVTHQFGYPTSIEKIVKFCKNNNILLIEDAAPSFGAKYKNRYVGTFGDIAFYSFQESKVISTINGGLIVGKDDLVKKIINSKFTLKGRQSSLQYFIKSIANLFIKEEHIYFVLIKLWNKIYGTYTNADKLDLELDKYAEGYLTLSKFQINLGLQQLNKIKSVLSNRNETAELYRKELVGLDSILSLPQSDLKEKYHTYSRFPVLVKNKNKVYAEVRKHGVDLGFTFSYLLPQYFEKCNIDNYKNSKFIISHILNIPIHNKMSKNNEIIKRVKSALIGLKA